MSGQAGPKNAGELNHKVRRLEVFQHVVGLGQITLNSLSVNKLDLPTPFRYLLYEKESQPASIRIPTAKHPGFPPFSKLPRSI